MAGIETPYSSYSLEAHLFPMEEMLEVGKRHKKLLVGIPREMHPYENRLPLTPESVDFLINKGHEILIEANAGKGANYHDRDYAEAGARIVENRSEIYNCDIILKVSPFTKEEIELLTKNQIIFSSLFLNNQTESSIRELMHRKVTSVAFEYLKDEENQYPVSRAMSEISGTTAIMIASEYLSNVHNGKGVLLGGITGITPTEVTIFGAGTAGECAAHTALGLGAIVKIFDNSLPKLRRIQEKLGQRVFTSIFHPPVIYKALKSSDVVIGALDLINERPYFMVTEEMVKSMKKGAVIIDISIEQGGCFETSSFTDHGNPVFTKHGIIHYCVPNIPSRVSRTASIALSNIFTPIIDQIGETGSIKQMLKENIGFRQGVYIYNGILTNKIIGNKFSIRSQDIDLLMTIF
jgi:alanine dehydrogenase